VTLYWGNGAAFVAEAFSCECGAVFIDLVCRSFDLGCGDIFTAFPTAHADFMNPTSILKEKWQ
jgi:hypothetical protein